ncbi:MAG: serine/threonine-protein kinase [Myxococcota bacterium]
MIETEGCYFVMEYLHGVDLTRFLSVLRERNLTMPLDHALTIALGMCAGLQYAHDMVGQDGQPLEIVHRDVSPSNVMVAYDGQIKVMDFGVAKALALTSFTEAGTRKGKLSYMPPEQARADVLDRRADVFAIGAVLYELTTMRRLFTGGNELAVIHQLMYEARTRPSSVVPGYPSALEELVLKAFEHKPEDRFSTAAELASAIEAFAAQAGLTISTSALGAFLREQITPPPHPAEDPEFFGGGADAGLPDAATAVEPIGPHDTSIEAFSEGGGLATHASPQRGGAAYPTTTAPYVAAPPPAVLASGPARPVGSGLSGAARAGLGIAAVLTLAASGGVAFLLTRSDPAPAPAARDDAVAPAAEPKTAPTPPPPATPEASPPVAEPEPPVPTPEVVDTPPPGVEPVEIPPPVDEPPPRTKKKKKKKKKKPVTDAKADPEPPPETKKKKKRNPTDTLLPGMSG